MSGMVNIYSIWVVLVGLALGSFLNVVIYRLPRSESLVKPGSRCPSCKKPIAWYDNIPIVSYFLLRGKCRHCGNRISWRYPVVEAITALVLSALFAVHGLTPLFFVYSVLVLFLIPIAFIDLQTGLIPNALTFSGFILGVILAFGLQFENWKSLLIGAVVGGAILLFFGILGRWIFRRESIGMGDVKLLVLIGVYMGFPEVVYSLFLGVFVAGLFILIGMLMKKIRLHDTVPFGPFIAIGTVVYMCFGNVLLSWYLGLFHY